MGCLPRQRRGKPHTFSSTDWELAGTGSACPGSSSVEIQQQNYHHVNKLSKLPAYIQCTLQSSTTTSMPVQTMHAQPSEIDPSFIF